MSDLKTVVEELKNNRRSIIEGHDTTSKRIEELSGMFSRFETAFLLQASDDLESKREKKNQRATTTKGKTQASSATGGGLGGGLGGILGAIAGSFGGLLKMGGMAGGALAGIIGLTALGLIDASKIKDNVTTLLSIGERYKEDTVKQLFSDGAVIVALKALGAALIVFAVGSGAAAGVNAGVEYFGQGDWAEKVRDNVNALLSIADNYTLGGLGVMYDGVGVSAALIGLGVGLAVFGVGGAAAGGALAFSGDDFGKKIRDNVNNLLDISKDRGGKIETLKEGGTVVLALAGLGYGLAAFGAGAVVASGADMLGDYFADNDDWSTTVVNNVKNILSIAQLPGVGADTLKFDGVMLGIAGGLAIFSAGATVAGISNALNDWIAPGEGRQDWTLDTKRRVGNILSIVTDNPDIESKTTSFKDAMKNISTGLTNLSEGSFINALKGAGERIVNFFTGGESPFANIKMVAQEAEGLERGASAIERLTVSIEKLSALTIDSSSLNLKGFASDLAESVPLIEKSITGNKFGKLDNKTQGLASPLVDFEKAAENIQTLRYALMVEPPSPAGGAQVTGAPLMVHDMKQIELLTDIQRQLTTGVTIINQDNSSNSSNNSSTSIPNNVPGTENVSDGYNIGPQ